MRRLFKTPTNIKLDDVEQELCALILQLPPEERQMAQDATSLRDAHLDLTRSLLAQNYDRTPVPRSFKQDLRERPSCV